ncbi:MAG: NlpC/P60 family protein [Archangium sp.]
MSVVLSLVLASLEIHASVDGAKPRAGWVYAKAGQSVTLHAVGKGAAEFRWFRIEPTIGAIDNTTPSFHFENVTYAESELTSCRGKPECAVDVKPTKLDAVNALPGVGTMAFRVEATMNGKAVSTPGMESTKYGGLTKDVFRVTFRRDDSLIGFATELINTPYIFGSAGPDGRNQSDLLIGSDCADLVIYARRRQGHKAEYTSSYAIDKQAPEVKSGPPKAGDLVHFPSVRHVAILFEDRPPIGELNDEDLILHTCWAPPTVQALKDTSCGAPPWRLLRFKN